MQERTEYEFYTAYSEQTVVASELKKEPYDLITATKILNEAQNYHIKLETRAQSWYEDEEEYTCETKSILTEQIIVKNGEFYGCLLTREYSEWGYNNIDKGTRLTLVTLDNPKANVYTMDHSTQNGDSYSITDALLIKAEK